MSAIYLPNKTLKKNYPAPLNDSMFRHFCLMDNGRFAVATYEKPTRTDVKRGANVYVGQLNSDELRSLELASVGGNLGKPPAQYLSVCMEANSVCATAPSIDRVLVWDFTSGVLRSEIEVKRAAGVCVAPDRQYFIVNSSQGELAYVSTASGKLARTEKEEIVNSSHVTMAYWSKWQDVI